MLKNVLLFFFFFATQNLEAPVTLSLWLVKQSLRPINYPCLLPAAVWWKKIQKGNLRMVVRSSLMEDLQRISTWSCAQSLLINPDKTNLLQLETPQMLTRVQEGFAVSLLGKEILPSPSAKSLGVVIDRWTRDWLICDWVCKIFIWQINTF